MLCIAVQHKIGAICQFLWQLGAFVPDSRLPTGAPSHNRLTCCLLFAQAHPVSATASHLQRRLDRWRDAEWLSWCVFCLFLQASYSSDGVFISVGLFCSASPDNVDHLSTLYAFPKSTLYSNPTSPSQSMTVMRATYLPSSSWYRSLPLKDQLLAVDPTQDPTSSNAFNTWVLPARPQTAKDVADPFFVIGKVWGMISLAQ